MARMSEIMIEIEELLRDGYSIEKVAKILGVPYQWVKEIHYAMDFDEGY